MMPPAKQMDPVLGIDIHLVIPPAPVPVPVPIPHPFVGMVLDPMEWLPVIGATVYVNGMPAAIAGAGVKAIPPHIPIGGPFAPPPPGNEGEMFMGSSTVSFDGDAASHMVHPALTCQSVGMPAPPRMNPKKKKASKASLMLPTSVVLPIPGGKPIMIGGPPTISLMSLGIMAATAGLGKGFRKFANSKLGKKLADKIKKARKKAFKNMKPGFLKCKILKAEPVNSVTGEVVVEQQDFSIPGRIPFAWTRTWESQKTYEGQCGKGWQTPADMRLEIDRDGTVFFFDGGPGATVFPWLPEVDAKPITEMSNGAQLTKRGKAYFVKQKSGVIYQFNDRDGSFGRSYKPSIRLYIERIEDSYNNYLLFERTEDGELTRLTESAGRALEVTSHDGLIRKIAFSHPEEEGVRPLLAYEYDENRNLIAVYDALDNPYRFEYKHDFIVRHTDRNGLSFYYDYDRYTKDGKCIHAWGDGGLYNYHFEYRPYETKFTNSLGHKRFLRYDLSDLPRREYDDDGDIAKYEYDDVGRTTAVIDGEGNRTEWEYDEFGDVLKLVRPDGTSVLREYDDNHNLTKVIDPNGGEWKQEWSQQGLVEKQITPLGNTTTYSYDQSGDVASSVDSNGSQSMFKTDRYANLYELVDGLQNTSRFESDVFGNTTREISFTGRETRYRYDANNRIVGIINPSGSQIDCAYDGEGNLTHYRDESGRVTKLEYTGIGEIGEKTHPDGTVVQYHWNTEEQLIGVTNERGQRYHLNRNKRGVVVEEIDYWNGSRRYTYDQAGRFIESIDPLDRNTQFKSDAFGRLISKTLFNGKSEIYDYDPNGNLVAHENEHVKCVRKFNAENQLVEEIQGDFKVEYDYDPNGNRINRKSSCGNEVFFCFDALDQLLSVRINDEPAVSIKKDADGFTVKETIAGCVERDYEYNEDGLLTQQEIYTSAIHLAKRRYLYDPVGNLTGRTDARKGNTYFSYDPMGRVKRIVSPRLRVEEFLYDPAGDLGKFDHQIDDATGVRRSEHNGVTYCHDGAGNVVERDGPKGTTRFEWNGNDRLEKAKNEAGQTTQMGYDAQGRRVFKETDGVKTVFSWDGDRLLSDNKDGKGPREFVHYPGTFEPLAFIDSDGDIYYYQNDNIGLPQEVCTSSGRIVWSATYGAFGAIDESFEQEIDNPIRFQGQYYDEEIDLSYNRFRFYDPNVGSFVSKDPLGLAAGHDVYRYGPNVWAWIDPFGFACKVYRVEGVGNSRVDIKNGNISIPDKQKMLHISFGNDAHAKYFLAKTKKRGHTDNVIKVFEVPDEVADNMRKKAVKQRDAKKFPDSPQIDDPTVSKQLGMDERDVLGLKSEQIADLEANAIPGTGGTL